MSLLSESQVYRFSEENNCNVSTRTGQLNLHIPIAAVTGNNGMGPSIAVALSYSSLNPARTPYGWRFDDTLSKYDRVQNRLYLSDGRVLCLDSDSGSGVLSFQKPVPVDCKIKTGKDNRIQVIHKDGTIEVFASLSRAEDILAVERIISPEGFSLYLAWERYAGYPRLTSISDESKTLLTTQSDNHGCISIFNNLTDNTTRQLYFKNKRLDKVCLSERPQPWRLKYDSYQRAAGEASLYLSGYITPAGLESRIMMDLPGLLCPSRTGRDTKHFTSLPAVRRVETIQQATNSSGERIIADRTVIEYNYSTPNFMGYGATMSPPPQHADHAVFAVNEYEYSVDCRMTFFDYDCTEKKYTPFFLTDRRYTYNKFHCLISRQDTFNDLLRAGDSEALKSDNALTYTLRQFTASVDLSRPFSEQVQYYAQPVYTATIWSCEADDGSDQSRKEESTFTYGCMGNLENQVHPDGSIDTFIWYPPGGEDGICPPDPHGFTRFVKTSTHTPFNSDFDCPVRRTSCTWIAHETRPAAAGIVSTFVVPAERTLAELGTTSPDTVVVYTKTAWTYETEDSLSPFYSALKSKVLLEADTADTLTTWTAFVTMAFSRTLSADSGTVDIVTSHTTADNLRRSSTRTFDALSCRLLSAEDALGNTTTYAYGSSPQDPYLKSVTFNADTEYENTTSCAWEFGPDPLAELTSCQSRLSITDAAGNIRRHTYSASGYVTMREYARAPVEGGSRVWFTTSTHRYASGLLQQSVAYDYHPETQVQLAAVSSEYRYSDWMQQSRVASSTGITTENYYDAVARTICVRKLQNEYQELPYDADSPVTSGCQVSQLDNAGNVISVSRYTAAYALPDTSDVPVSELLYRYDGLNRLRSLTDAYQNTTVYTPDFYARTVSIIRPDNSITRYDYQSLHRKPVKVTVQASATSPSTVAGERALDGLGRVISASVGGRQYDYAFDSASQAQPSVVTQPDSSKLGITYDPHLGNAVLTISDVTVPDAPKVLKAFSYNKQFGWKVDGTDYLSSLREELSWNSQGHPTQSLLRAGTDSSGAEKITNEFDYSLGGRLTAATVSSGAVEITSRSWGLDTHGRAQMYSDSLQQSTLSYDELNRIRIVTTESLVSTDNITATTGYDDFGRPLTISYVQGSAENTLMGLNSDYDLMGRIVNKTIKYPEQSLTLESAYHYDGQGRMIQNDNNSAGTEMNWEYDCLNNVTAQTISDADSGNLLGSWTYSFSAQDPCQLARVTDDLTAQTTPMQYNANGCLTNDGVNVTDYDIFSRAIEFNNESCLYDANDRWRGDTMLFNYMGTEITENISVSFESDGTAAIYSRTGNTTQGYHTIREGETTFSSRSLTDNHATVLGYISGDNKLCPVFYDAWGKFEMMTGNQQNSVMTQVSAQNAPPAFNGVVPMYPDSSSTDDTAAPAADKIVYPLGAGYRNYNPALMRFCKPDSASPFGAGGVNGYAYAGGDPINNTDPSGHFFGMMISWAVRLDALNRTFPFIADAPDPADVFGETISKLEAVPAKAVAYSGAAVPGPSATEAEYATAQNQRTRVDPAEWDYISAGAGEMEIITSLCPVSTQDIYDQLLVLKNRASFRAGNPRKVKVLSGTHGLPSGNNYTASGERIPELLTTHGINMLNDPILKNHSTEIGRPVDVIDMATQSPQDLEDLFFGDDHVIFGTCFSRNDIALRHILELSPEPSQVDWAMLTHPLIDCIDQATNTLKW